MRKVTGLLDTSFGLAKQALLDLHKKFDAAREGGNVFTRYKLMKRMIKVGFDVFFFLGGGTMEKKDVNLFRSFKAMQVSARVPSVLKYGALSPGVWQYAISVLFCRSVPHAGASRPVT